MIQIASSGTGTIQGPRNTLLVDVLRFSEIVQTTDDGKLGTLIYEWIEFVRSCASDAKIRHNDIHFFSDTLFVITDGLVPLLSFSKLLLERGSERKPSFLLRGAIASGGISHTHTVTDNPSDRDINIVSGKPVIQAHKL